MSEAPERIWADGNAEWDSGSWGRDKEYDEDVEYTRTDLVRAEIEAAVKRALEGAVKCCDAELRNTAMLLSNPPKSSAAWDAANAIRALDPAQFVDGDSDG